MRIRPAVIALSLGWLPVITSLGAPPVPLSAEASCVRSARLLACNDTLGNRYAVAVLSGDMYLNGYEAAGHRTWAQSNSRFGLMTFFSGIASDGEVWVGYTRRVGWNTVTRVSSSSGAVSKISCNRLQGCQ